MWCSFLFFRFFRADLFSGAHTAFHSAQLRKLLEGTLLWGHRAMVLGQVVLFLPDTPCAHEISKNS